MDLKEKVKKLLIAGAKPSQVAKSLGCDPSYITQLTMDVNFINEILEARAAEVAAAKNLNERYDRIENKLLDKLEAQVDMLPMKTLELLRALQVTGSRKRETILPDPDSQVEKQTVIHLHLPQRLVQKFVMNNAKNDVVGIGDKILAPMPSTELMKEAEVIEQEIKNLGQQTGVNNEQQGTKTDAGSRPPETAPSREGHGKGCVPEISSLDDI